MAAGFRSPAFWLGIAAAPVSTTGSVRSLLAPWLGGASAPAAATAQAGIRSFLAPWLGGASASPVAPPVVPVIPSDGHPQPVLLSGGQVLAMAHQYPDANTETRIDRQLDILRDDKEVLELVSLLAYTLDVWQRNA